MRINTCGFKLNTCFTFTNTCSFKKITLSTYLMYTMVLNFNSGLSLDKYWYFINSVSWRWTLYCKRIHVLIAPAFIFLSKILSLACNSWHLINIELTKYVKNLNWRNDLHFFLFLLNWSNCDFFFLYIILYRWYIFLIILL